MNRLAEQHGCRRRRTVAPDPSRSPQKMKQSPRVANCRTRIVSKPCPMTWDQFWRTKKDSVRHCDVCKEDVYYCKSDSEAIEQAKAGHCIAIEMVAFDELPTIVIGRPTNPAPRTAEQEKALQIQQIEFEKIRALKDLKFADRYCDQCGYPIASFRKHCWVCAKTIPGEHGEGGKASPATS